METKENNTNLPINNIDIKESLKKWDINSALKWLFEKIQSWIEFSRDFLNDLFRIRESTKNLSENETIELCEILDNLLPIDKKQV